MTTSAPKIETYLNTHLLKPGPTITHALTNSDQNGIPAISLAPSQGRFLQLLATATSAKNILEIGTLGGHSTIWLARALQSGSGGKVTSLDINPHHQSIATENLRFAGVSVPEDVELLLGAALDILPKLEEEIQAGVREPFDFVFVDADWDNQHKYFDFGVRVARKGSVIFVDNTVQALLHGGVLEGQGVKGGMGALVEEVGKDGRVEAVVVQTVGARSFDGFLMGVAN
ncbi:S-adenosyl-L-methionine-dependent methyltransferase [Aspergillus ellipticus CBS 707.79]|uniref:S-adenosyl-L-methionine-dependent methyltransferase n=1 Tax=Aspergillus ellipticus CBS 707.79 TaxID=1448320 RepID=A0A319CV82_9EURO|nr:S-adenosyl-L-methionine-dependent methyltransferase [Aspergillus ellipticus CBS 707.79]